MNDAEKSALREERLEIAARHAKKLAEGNADLERNWHFHLLYNEKAGAFGWRKKNPVAISRRQFIEALVKISDKDFNIVPLEYNQSQRNLEAMVLRAERANQPVRIVIVKVRQNGISTYVLAVCLWLMLTRPNKRLRIIADRDDLCREFLSRMRTMLRNMKRADGTLWNLKAKASNRDEIILDAPFHSSVHVVSANTESPGFGETMALVDMEETSKWNNPVEAAKGVLMTLPARPGTYAFNVSQPKGNTGYFAELFMRAWRRKRGLVDNDSAEITNQLDALMRAGSWEALFIPWFLHHEYRISKVGNNVALSTPDLQRSLSQLAKQLDPEESVLVKQRYLTRGHGWRHVDLDQLAWRRYWIETQCNGSLDTFHEQCPAFPEEAFLASGRPAFNIRHVQRAMAEHERNPLFKGNVVQSSGVPRLLDDPRGPLWIWKHRDPKRAYAIGVDTSAGVRGGDPCAALVVDVETDEVVAEWYGWEVPHVFGLTVKSLSDLYEAETAIETEPSAHGLAVYETAEGAGCRRLFVQQRWDDREGRFVTSKGWRTNEKSKMLLMSGVARALMDNVPVPSQRLLQEILDCQLDENDKVAKKCRNDLVMGFGLAMKLADMMRVENVKKPTPKPLPPTGSDEAFWESRRSRLAGQAPAREGEKQGHYDNLNGQGL